MTRWAKKRRDMLDELNQYIDSIKHLSDEQMMNNPNIRHIMTKEELHAKFDDLARRVAEKKANMVKIDLD